MVTELPVEKLRREFSSTLLECETTEDLTPLEGIIGQDRGVRALKFGLDIKEHGFNIYVAGAPGTGRTTAVKDFVDVFAKTKPVPSDWCYVNNFRDSYEPKAIQLPPGKGKVLQQDVKDFIEEVRRELPKVFESEDYVAKREETIRSIEEERRALFSQLNRRAQEEGFLLQSTTMGILMIPLSRGKPMTNEEIMALNPQIRQEIEKKREKLGIELRNAIRQLQSLEKKANEAIKKLNKEVTLYTIGHLISDLSKKYQEFREITTYLNDVQNDILDNITQFVQEPKPSPQMPFQA
ncbi:MAG: AAA family ATPase, partial [Candidatus Bathyarchaeota archaeon]